MNKGVGSGEKEELISSTWWEVQRLLMTMLQWGKHVLLEM